jgi:hypothetical protein
MKNSQILLIALLVFFAALLLPFLLHVVGAIVGITFGIVITLGIVLFIGFILVIAFSGAGILVGGILGVVGVVLLALALPILAPLFIVLLPLILLVWLVLNR